MIMNNENKKLSRNKNKRLERKFRENDRLGKLGKTIKNAKKN